MLSKNYYCRFFAIVLNVIIIGACSPDNNSIPIITLFEQDTFPRTLSDWGIVYSQDRELRINDGVIAYDLQSPLFTDYAHKLRTIWIPKGEQMSYSVESGLQLPVGSIVSKTFYYPITDAGLIKTNEYAEDFINGALNLETVKLIETRLMVHLADGWHALPYVWDEEQQNATLEITGAAKLLTLVGNDSVKTFPYIVPDANQCQGCHVENMTKGAMALLGVKARHLNKGYNGVFSSENQLEHWRTLEKLDLLPDHSHDNIDWTDEGFSIDQQARSYLDINCGHCHNPVGPADTSGLFLQFSETDPLRLGVCKPPVAAGQGTGGRRVGIFPGDHKQSILSFRMESLDLGAIMPELGRSLVHKEGLDLINHWIDGMPGDCEEN